MNFGTMFMQSASVTCSKSLAEISLLVGLVHLSSRIFSPGHHMSLCVIRPFCLASLSQSYIWSLSAVLPFSVSCLERQLQTPISCPVSYVFLS